MKFKRCLFSINSEIDEFALIQRRSINKIISAYLTNTTINVAFEYDSKYL